MRERKWAVSKGAAEEDRDMYICAVTKVVPSFKSNAGTVGDR